MAIQILSPDYITPDNDIWLLKLIPLEENYENTILWEQGKDINGTLIVGETIAQARARQFNWFTSTSGALHISSTTYQREGRKYVRVDKPIKDLIGYNYIVFKNNGQETVGGVVTNRYENKYYYGFITNYEYVNDRVTVVHYSIDLMQTFNFDYVVDQCFVEREHSSTDNIGENTLDENLPVGNVIYSLKPHLSDFNNWSICVISSENFWQDQTTGQWVSGGNPGKLIANMYTGAGISSFASAADVNDFLTAATALAKSDAIVNIMMVPSTVVAAQAIGSAYTSPWYIDRDVNWTYTFNNKQGPRNKKLYCYPYNKLYITNNNGDATEYRYELFSGNSATLVFQTYFTIFDNGEISITPMDYRIEDNTLPIIGHALNHNERFCLKGFPQCAFTIDSYRAWLAQNKGQLISEAVGVGLNFGSALLQGTAAVATANVGLALGAGATAINTLNQASQMLGKNYDMSRVPDTVRGQQTAALTQQEGLMRFDAYNVHVVPEYASMIDDYFDMFGYSCRRLKVPNRNVRENWCYCKTVGCRLTGAIPGDVDKKICSIYDNGIRFWKNPNNIGRYNTLTNNCIANSQNNGNILEVHISPSTVEVTAGQTMTLTSTVTGGTPPYNYQWEYKTANASSYTNVLTNGNSANYSLVTASRHSGNSYKLVVTDSENTVAESNVSTLTVL